MPQESRIVRTRAEMEVPPGSRQAFHLATAQETDGRPLLVPVEIIAGAKPGPRLVCVAGVHGDEIEGIVALQELASAIDPAQLSGTLVLVKVANPAAFVGGRRRTPADDADLNRLFPGRADGSFSSRHAERVFNELIVGADFLFTLHSGPTGWLLAPYVEVPFGDDDVCKRSMAAAEASGFERISPLVWHEGVLPAAANRIGIPAMEAEIGGEGRTDENGWKKYVAVCRALLAHLKMLSAEPPPKTESRLVAVTWPMNKEGGLWRRHVAIEAQVAAGDLLGTVHDLHGNVVEEIRAKDAGQVVGHRMPALVHAGAVVLTIARPLRPGERPTM